MTAVVFDVETFRKVHPAFSDEVRFTDEMLTACFDQAVEIVGNGDDSAIPYDPTATPPVKTRAVVLDLLTCHIATQNYLWGDQQAAPLTNAAEGSVSAGFGSLADANNPSWWASTKCGAQAWQIMQRYASGPLYFGIKNLYMGG